MSTADRRQEEKEQRRNDIIDAAEVVFAQKGVDKATMADVAKAARLSRGLIYFYFKDKDDLYLAIMLRATQTLRTFFEKAVAIEKSGFDKIRAMGRAYVDFSIKKPDYFHALVDFEARNIEAANPQENEAECLLEGNKLLEMMTAVIIEGMQDGSIRQDIGDPLQAAISLWGFTHGIIQIRANKEQMFTHLFQIDSNALMNQAFDMMERSLQP